MKRWWYWLMVLAVIVATALPAIAEGVDIVSGG